MKEYNKIFWLLVGHGHCGAKAAEIILDAKRGNKYARQWISAVFKMRRP